MSGRKKLAAREIALIAWIPSIAFVSLVALLSLIAFRPLRSGLATLALGGLWTGAGGGRTSAVPSGDRAEIRVVPVVLTRSIRDGQDDRLRGVESNFVVAIIGLGDPQITQIPQMEIRRL